MVTLTVITEAVARDVTRRLQLSVGVGGVAGVMDPLTQDTPSPSAGPLGDRSGRGRGAGG